MRIPRPNMQTYEGGHAPLDQSRTVSSNTSDSNSYSMSGHRPSEPSVGYGANESQVRLNHNNVGVMNQMCEPDQVSEEHLRNERGVFAENAAIENPVKRSVYGSSEKILF